MVFIFPSYIYELPQERPSTCLLVQSGDWIPCLAFLLIQLCSTYYTAFVSTHSFSLTFVLLIFSPI